MGEKCENCNREIKGIFAIIGKCRDCIMEGYRCKECGRYCKEEEFNKEEEMCSKCIERIFVKCEECKRTSRRDDIGIVMGKVVCGNCLRHLSKYNVYWGGENTEMTDELSKSEEFSKTCGIEYTFGLEIETARTENPIRAIESEEIKIIIEGKEYKLKDIAKSVFDGSITGTEIVTCVLKGDKGVEAVEKICKILKEREYKVEEKAGLHLHIGIPKGERSSDNIKKIAMIYSVAEDTIFRMLPEPRKISKFCVPIKGTKYFEGIMQARNIIDIESQIYETIEPSLKKEMKMLKGERGAFKRYFGINIHSIFHRGTLEIRYHSSTIDEEKMKKWIKLNLGLVKLALTKTTKEVESIKNEYEKRQAKKRVRMLKGIIDEKEIKELEEYIEKREKELVGLRFESMENGKREEETEYTTSEGMRLEIMEVIRRIQEDSEEEERMRETEEMNDV